MAHLHFLTIMYLGASLLITFNENPHKRVQLCVSMFPFFSASLSRQIQFQACGSKSTFDRTLATASGRLANVMVLGEPSKKEQ